MAGRKQGVQSRIAAATGLSTPQVKHLAVALRERGLISAEPAGSKKEWIPRYMDVVALTMAARLMAGADFTPVRAAEITKAVLEADAPPTKVFGPNVTPKRLAQEFNDGLLKTWGYAEFRASCKDYFDWCSFRDFLWSGTCLHDRIKARGFSTFDEVEMSKRNELHAQMGGQAGARSVILPCAMIRYGRLPNNQVYMGSSSESDFRCSVMVERVVQENPRKNEWIVFGCGTEAGDIEKTVRLGPEFWAMTSFQPAMLLNQVWEIFEPYWLGGC